MHPKLIERLLRQHHGSVAGASRQVGIKRQTFAWWVKRRNLDEFAAQLRAEYGISGTRSALDKGSLDPTGERQAIRAALDEHGSQTGAAKSLGIHRRRLQRAMERLGINT